MLASDDYREVTTFVTLVPHELAARRNTDDSHDLTRLGFVHARVAPTGATGPLLDRHV